MPASNWIEVLASLDGIAVALIKKRMMQGDVKAVAQLLIQQSCVRPVRCCSWPRSRIASMLLTFWSGELWQQRAHDKTAALDRMLLEQQRTTMIERPHKRDIFIGSSTSHS